MHLINDPHFCSVVLNKIERPQLLTYQAMHQDYSENFVADEAFTLGEDRYGEIAVDRCLKFGHFGTAEHAQIVINFGWFPHSVMQQIRTHRTGISFDVQSMRYSGTRMVKWAEGVRSPEEFEKLIYLRPVGEYTDRQGGKYLYTEMMRQHDKMIAADLVLHYADRLKMGVSEEHARGLLPFEFRQHFVMSANLRTCLHLLNVRYKADVQPEAQTWASHLWGHIQDWVPEIAAYYEAKMLGKAKLTP